MTQRGLSRFIETFHGDLDLPFGHLIKLMDIFGSLPELIYEYEYSYAGYKPHLLKLEIRKKDNSEYDVLYIDKENDTETLLREVKDLQTNYIFQRTENSIILRRKLDYQDIGVYSIYGEKFLQVPVDIGGKKITLPILILIYMGLYALGYISRYHPEIWSPFLRTDNTGETNLIEKFLKICRRKIPNLILDFIFDIELHFVNKQYDIEILHNNQDDSKLRQVIREEIRKALYEERMK